MQSESIVHVDNRPQNEAKIQDDDLDISIESLFGDEAISSVTNVNKIIEEIVEN